MPDNKRTRKFKAKHLEKTIADRRKSQAKRKEIQGRQQKKLAKAARSGGRQRLDDSKKAGDRIAESAEGEDGDDSASDDSEARVDMTVDDLLDAKDLGDLGAEDEDEGDSGEETSDDLESLNSEIGSTYGMDLEALREADPEFYKYLEQNDRDLLDFDPNSEAAPVDQEEDEPPDMVAEQGKEKQIVVTREMLRSWQKAILEKRSVRAMRKLLLAFRSAAFSASEEGPTTPFAIESSSVFKAVVKTALKYMPVYLSQILPATQLPNGKFKVPTHSKMYGKAQRILKSYFSSLIELLSQLPARPDSDTGSGDNLLYTAVGDAGKLTPWIVGNRKMVKTWSKTLLELWATADDQIRIVAFLALRRLALASNPTAMDAIMKGTYTALVRSARSTGAYTLPTINLMKNSAVELYLVDSVLSYQLIFGYIRQLAIHLRNSMKLKSKEGFQAVYNWQFIHSLDFWSLVLSSACDLSREGTQSPLHPLIYPLVQIAIGVVRLVPTPRYYPLRFHCVRLLLRLSQRTGTYIPVVPYLFETISSPSFTTRRLKNSSVKPLDWEHHLRTPKAYHNTRVYADIMSEEAIHFMLESYALRALSISFPEEALTGIVMLKRLAKVSKNAKLNGQIKTLAEKLEAQRVWVEERRSKVEFGPNDMAQVRRFLDGQDPVKTPLGAHFRLQKKIREQKKATIERSMQGVVLAD